MFTQRTTHVVPGTYLNRNSWQTALWNLWNFTQRNFLQNSSLTIGCWTAHLIWEKSSSSSRVTFVVWHQSHWCLAGILNSTKNDKIQFPDWVKVSELFRSLRSNVGRPKTFWAGFLLKMTASRCLPSAQTTRSTKDQAIQFGKAAKGQSTGKVERWSSVLNNANQSFLQSQSRI